MTAKQTKGIDMRFILLALLLLCHSKANAVDFFFKDKSCKSTSETIEVKLSTKLSNLNDKTSEKRRLRSKAIEKYNNKGINAESVHVVDQFHLEISSRKNNSSFSKVTGHLDYVGSFTPSKNCNKQKAITEDMFIAGKHKQGKTHIVKGKKIEFTVNMSNGPKFKEFNDMRVTPSLFFGQQLGQSLEQTRSALGLASLELGSENKKILIYGRNHAFHFIDSKLVGYQFHINLLPMMLNNELPLTNKELEIHLDSHEPIKLNTALTTQLISKLKQSFSSINTATYKKSMTETQQQIAGISQGTLVKSIKGNSNCYGGNGLVDDYIKKNRSNFTLELLNADHEKIIITNCNELLYDNAGYISKIKLIEPFSTKNIKLKALANYFKKSSAWQFAGVKYEGFTDSLSSIGEYDEFLDKAEFTSELWNGYFHTYDGLLISAELMNNN